MTNYEKIMKKMTIQRMATNMNNHNERPYDYCQIINHCHLTRRTETCYSCIKSWLESEADND